MNTVEKLNFAIDYVEKHIEEKLDIEEISKMVFMSSYDFQRVFSFISGISLYDYIRYRRLTLAGRLLKDEDVKVIEVALRYSYNSPTSFTRAFQDFHGVTPNVAKKGNVRLNSFSRLVFQIAVKEACDVIQTDTIVILGKEYMASYFGEQNIEKWSTQFYKREYRRIEEAYDDFEKLTKSGDVLPYNNYPPININIGQVFALDYYSKKNGDVVRRYYISDGTVWQNLPCTSEVLLPKKEGGNQ